MAQSFWSKRKETINTTGGYIQATNAVSRPTAILMVIFGILIVGGLLFGIFTGTRWAYGKLTDKSGSNISQTTNIPSSNTTTSGPSVTITSSTSTTTPSTTSSTTAPTPAQTPATTVVAADSTALPRTGAGTNLTLFFTLVVIGYVLYRRHAVRS